MSLGTLVPKTPDLLVNTRRSPVLEWPEGCVTFAGFSRALLCSVVLTVQQCPGGVVYESRPYKWLNFQFGDPDELRTRMSGVRISPGAPTNQSVK
jgi:hypothetical protein